MVLLLAVLLLLTAGLVVVVLVLVRRTRPDYEVGLPPPMFAAPPSPEGSIASHGAIVPPTGAATPAVPRAPSAPSPAAPASPAASPAAPVASTMAESMAGAMTQPIVVAMQASTADLAPVLARLRELGADGVIDPEERTELEAKAAAAMPGATIEELTVDQAGYRLRVQHQGADITASGTWQGGEWGQTVAVSQTITHAFDAGTGADLGQITDPELRAMVEGMLNALDAK